MDATASQSSSKKRKREPPKHSSVFSKTPCECKLETILKSVHLTPFNEIKSQFENPRVNQPLSAAKPDQQREALQRLVDALLPEIKAQVTKSLERFQVIYKNLVDKPLRIIAHDDDDTDTLLGITLPDASTQASGHQDAQLGPPPAKRAKKSGPSSTNTTTEMVNSSLDESFSLLDTSFQDDRDTLPPRPALASPQSESKSRYKQMILVPMRPRHTRTLPKLTEAALTDSIHKAFLSKFRISKKYHSPLSGSLPEIKSNFSHKSATATRIVDPSRSGGLAPSIFPLNYSDLATLYVSSNSNQDSDLTSSQTSLRTSTGSASPLSSSSANLLSPIRPTLPPQPPSSSSSSAVRTEKEKKTPVKRALTSPPGAAAKKRTTAPPKPSKPKTPAKAPAKSPAKTPVTAALPTLPQPALPQPSSATALHDAVQPEADVEVASMLMSLAAKSKTAPALMSPSKQTTLLQFLPAAAPK